MGCLCTRCAAAIEAATLIPEHVQSPGCAATAFFLIDQWGRAHGVAPGVVLGRNQGLDGLALLGLGVSRHHARLEVCDSGSGIALRDLGSTNGCFVNARRVSDVCALEWGDVVHIATVGLYFEPASDALIAATTSSVPTRELDRQPEFSADATLVGDPAELTRGELSVGPLRFAEAMTGGGVMIVGQTRIRLTRPQFELMQLLAQRAAADQTRDPDVRGFVSTSEIIGTISWDSRHPDDANVKQLVRRIRLALQRAEAPDLIESEQGFGYRLRLAATHRGSA